MKIISIKGIVIGYISSMVVNIIIGVPFAYILFYILEEPSSYKRTFPLMIFAPLIGIVGHAVGSYLTGIIATRNERLNALILSFLVITIHIIDSYYHGKLFDDNLFFEIYTRAIIIPAVLIGAYYAKESNSKNISN